MIEILRVKTRPLPLSQRKVTGLDGDKRSRSAAHRVCADGIGWSASELAQPNSAKKGACELVFFKKWILSDASSKVSR